LLALQSEIRNPKSEIDTFSGEIASRLAYTQKSRGQNLPERPFQLRIYDCGLRIGEGRSRQYNKEQTPNEFAALRAQRSGRVQTL